MFLERGKIIEKYLEGHQILVKFYTQACTFIKNKLFNGISKDSANTRRYFSFWWKKFGKDTSKEHLLVTASNKNIITIFNNVLRGFYGF